MPLTLHAADNRQPRSHEEKRISLLEAATNIFGREGYSGANIDMIAAEAGVSRQTVYNHHGDKEKLFIAVVQMLTDRINAGIFETLATFPDMSGSDDPDDLQTKLIDFAVRLNRGFVCDHDGKQLRKLIDTEGQRYPGLFECWREDGPGKTWAALAAHLARLAHAGHLDIDDPDMAARQFLALISADLRISIALGDKLGESRVREAVSNGVRTFMRAFASDRNSYPMSRSGR